MRARQSGAAPAVLVLLLSCPSCIRGSKGLIGPHRSGIGSGKARYGNHIPFLKSVQLLNHQTALALATERCGPSVFTVHSKRWLHSHNVHWLTTGTVSWKRPHRVRTAIGVAFPNSFHQHTFTENSLTLSHVHCEGDAYWVPWEWQLKVRDFMNLENPACTWCTRHTHTRTTIRPRNVMETAFV